MQALTLSLSHNLVSLEPHKTAVLPKATVPPESAVPPKASVSPKAAVTHKEPLKMIQPNLP